MKKYFVCSDIHGFYKEWVTSLKEASFDKDNPNHHLIVLGDIFDRGLETWKIYRFLKGFPQERLILVKGNHEDLLINLVKKQYPDSYDFSNGTYQTLVTLSKDPRKVEQEWILTHINEYEDTHEMYVEANKIYQSSYKKLFNNKKLNEIIEWLNSPIWKDYYELDKYIFVHSFIPLRILNPAFMTVEYNPNWRNDSTEAEIFESKWDCPYRPFLAGLFDEEIKQGKILVCGHWHTSDFYNELLYKDNPEKQLDIRTNNPIFKSDKYPNLIGIDGCTALTHKVNVLVIEETEL